MDAGGHLGSPTKALRVVIFVCFYIHGRFLLIMGGWENKSSKQLICAHDKLVSRRIMDLDL